MLVFLALGNAKVLSFALGDAKVPNANDFVSQWNIGFNVTVKMGMNCADDPFNMGIFYNSRCHSKCVFLQIPNTHIRASLYLSHPSRTVAHQGTDM